MLVLVVGLAMAGALVAGLMSFSSDSNTSTVRVWDPAHGHYHDANGVQVP
jgi:hypothetical protein